MNLLEAIKELREKSPKRNFKQNFDLVINLKEVNLKTNPIDLSIVLPHPPRKKTRICAFVDKELFVAAKTIFDTTIPKEDFSKWKDKKKIKHLEREHNFFVAQGTLMVEIATIFGRILGPKNKMPNPKANTILPPKEDALKPSHERLQKTCRVIAKLEPIIKCTVGHEDMPDKEISENLTTLYNALVHILPEEKKSVSNILLKLTMSPPIKLEL